MGSSTSPPRRRREKVRALAAAGLVLGTGATLALAAWTDSVFAGADFATATFGVQGNTGNPATPGDWQEYDTSGTAATFVFGVAVDAMRPGDSAYAPIALRTIPHSAAANVTLTPAAHTGSTLLYDSLTYRVVESATCNAGAFTANFIVGNSSTRVALDTGSAANAITLAAGTASPGTAKSYCFELHLADTHWTTTGLPGSTVDLEWEFAATSAS